MMHNNEDRVHFDKPTSWPNIHLDGGRLLLYTLELYVKLCSNVQSK